jgi:3-hydroxybutyryl-CoA dehydrogenase
VTAIKTVGVVGAGTMGNGIAQVCAAACLNVVMVDISDTAIQKGIATIDVSLTRLVKKEHLTPTDKDAILSRIKGSTDYDSLKAVDLAIEAATENEALKLQILEKIDAIVPHGAIVATNTSSLSVTRLAAATARPERFIGTHFFNPVPVMALLELIRGLRTSDETVAAIQAFSAAIGKTTIVARNSPGFAVNRILCPMINEAIFALQEGLAAAEEIDAGMRLGANHPIGPLALADLIGLDTFLAVMEMLYDGFNDTKYRPAGLLKEMVAAGLLGRKSGQGFYSYP